MHLDLGLSRISYDKLKKYIKTYGYDLLPCYPVMMTAAEQILPKSLKEKLTLTDRNILFPLQGIS